ncbi:MULTISPECIES: TetR/AcrR family transcriptional regulator [unclassified Rathayibacter]|uniref:TetR/AcrR family transcriptional regulator n=1 Tax=unclassified Rathayibacter TaxID=2609250 RepID=UPI0006F78092|nr:MULTISPECIES: TetR/AcrR family transcriptional regulator [unclassified Rathayibacter]KQQ03379.1 hypothetical protein ASF42_07575 [Rathayibacter sp. Leaf294]KQS11834.1 hypothetical protein ASG06_07575 [Rathayibacter sp. Leaf185]
MGRWEPDARGRLLRAAIELFAERGYDATTAAQIAERAGLTKTTLFRYFADKREIVFQGEEKLAALATEGVAHAPVDAAAFDILRAGLQALCDPETGPQQEIGRALEPILGTSAELRERAGTKRSTLTRALQEALAVRLGDPRLAGLLADTGMRAYYEGFGTWLASADDVLLVDVVDAELSAYWSALLRAAAEVDPAG